MIQWPEWAMTVPVTLLAICAMMSFIPAAIVVIVPVRVRKRVVQAGLRRLREMLEIQPPELRPRAATIR